MSHSKNLIKLVVLSNSLNILTGIAVIIPYIIKESAAGYFHSPMATMGYIFGFYILGMNIFQYVNGYVVKYLSIKQEVYLLAALYVMLTTLMYFIHNPICLIPILLCMGFIFGMAATLPNYIIVHTFHDEDRSSKLNKLDFWFSVGSLSYPIIAGIMVERHFAWQCVYSSVIIFIIFIVILCAKTNLPNVSKSSHRPESDFSPFILNTWLIGVALFLSFFAKSGFVYWLSYNARHVLHLSPEYANFTVSMFWITSAIGCFFSSYILKYIKVDKYIILSSMLIMISYFMIYNSFNAVTLYLSITILGLGCATVFASSISYATLIVENPSPRVVSYIIFTSGIASYLGENFSTWVKHTYGMFAVTSASTIITMLSIAVYVYVSFTSKIVDYHHTHHL